MLTGKDLEAQSTMKLGILPPGSDKFSKVTCIRLPSNGSILYLVKDTLARTLLLAGALGWLTDFISSKIWEGPTLDTIDSKTISRLFTGHIASISCRKTKWKSDFFSNSFPSSKSSIQNFHRLGLWMIPISFSGEPSIIPTPLKAIRSPTSFSYIFTPFFSRTKFQVS